MLRLFHRFTAALKDRKGFAPIETLVVMPILLVAVSAVVNLAALGKQQSDLLKATHAATQAAAAAGYLSPGANAAAQASLGGSLAPNRVSLQGPTAKQAPGTPIQLSANAAFNPPVPGVSIPGLGNVTIKAADREKVLVVQKDVTPVQAKGVLRTAKKQGDRRDVARQVNAAASGGFWESMKSRIEEAAREIAAYARKVFAFEGES